MPPKGDRPSAPAGGASKGGAAASKGAAAPAKEKEKGIFGGLRDMFSGGAKSGPTAADRPRARPDVVKTGTGKDAKFMDTRTGQSFAAPSYGAFSFRGLTSNDPANVARNRYGREGLEAMRAARESRDGPSRDRSDEPRYTLPVMPTPTPVPAAPTPEELAAIGAPTTPLGPVFVDTPVYGLPALQPSPGYTLPPGMGMPMGQPVPQMNYGSAFMGSPQQPSIYDMDIFAAYPNLGIR
jgi:hypothetical protein